LVTFHVSVVLPPGAIDVADAERLALGALGVGGLVVPPPFGECPRPPQPVNAVKKESTRIAKQALGSRTTCHLEVAACENWSGGVHNGVVLRLASC